MTRMRRSGTRPATSTEGPHRQLDQQASPELWGRLVAGVFSLAGTLEGRSQVSPITSRAVFLVDEEVERVPGSSLVPGARLEPAHLHGFDDTSVHLCLPVERGRELVELGWAEPHQYEEAGTELMVCGPRTAKELAVVLSLVEESIRFARGGHGATPWTRDGPGSASVGPRRADCAATHSRRTPADARRAVTGPRTRVHGRADSVD